MKNEKITDRLLYAVALVVLFIVPLLVSSVEAADGPKMFRAGKLADRIITADYAHHETHSGNHYQTSIMNTLGSGAFVNTIINTPAANFDHMLLRMDAQGETLIQFYRSPTCSSLGTAQTVSNMNDVSSNTAGTEISLNPTCSAEGTLIPGWSQRLGSGQQTGGESRAANEHILKQSTLYGVRITSLAANNDIDHIYDFYEDSGDAP